MLHVHIVRRTYFPVAKVWLRQLERCDIALLLCNELVDALHLRRIDESALHAHWLVAVEEEHIASSYELVSAWAVENGL